MRALHRHQRRICYDAQFPDPQPADGDVIVRPNSACLTHMDLFAHSDRSSFEGVLGTTFIGTVEHAESAAGVTVGSRVAASIATHCGTCDMCSSGLREHCRDRQLLGLNGRHGCLADRVLVPAGNLARVPEGLDTEQAVFAVPLAAALQTARQLTIEGRPYITVLGDNTLALLVAQVLARLNASVRLVGHSEAALAACSKASIKHRVVNEVGRRADQDIVVDCSGKADVLQIALELVRPRGTVVLKSPAVEQALLGIDLSPIVLKEITLLGSWTGPVGEALAMLERREVEVAALLSRRMTLDDGVALVEAATRPDVISVLVDI